MMRDALKPVPTGLVRPVPERGSVTPNEEAGTLSQSDRNNRSSPQTRHSNRTRGATRRGEIGDSGSWTDGFFRQRRRLGNAWKKRPLTEDVDSEERGLDATKPLSSERDDGAPPYHADKPAPDRTVAGLELTEEDTVKAIALEDNVSTAANAGGSNGIRGTGRAYRSLEEMIKEQLNDPAFPMDGSSETWAEQALTGKRS